MTTPLSAAPFHRQEEVLSLLRSSGVVWLYGPDRFLLEKMSERRAGDYPHVFWLRAGKTASQLSQACNEMGHTLEPSWGKSPPRNYWETLISRIQSIQERSLFIILGFQPPHFSILKKLKGIVSENRHMIITSQRQFHDEALYCHLPPHPSMPASTLSDLAILSALDREGKINEWRTSGLSPFQFVCTTFPYLWLVNGCTLPSDFVKTSLKLDLEALQSYGIIKRISGPMVEFYSIDDADLTTVQEMARQAIPLLRTVVPNCLQEKDHWAIHFAQTIYEHLSEDFLPSDPQWTLFFSSLLLQMGHFCTQTGNLSLARELTVKARTVIETSFKLKERDKKKKKEKGVEDFEKLYQSGPHGAFLVYLYAQIQYQAGRLCFYSKEPDEKLGSKGLLQYAKSLMSQLENQEKKPFLLTCLIERNGLLFHLMEEGEYKEAISGYQELLKIDEALDPDFQKKGWTSIRLDQDSIFQITCLRYIIAGSAKLGAVDPADIGKLKECLNKASPEQGMSASIALLEGFIEQGDIEASESELNFLLTQNIPPHYRLSFLHAQLNLFILKKDVEQIRKTALQYRQEAAQHYAAGAAEIYLFLLYENLTDPSNLPTTRPFPFDDVERKIQTLLNTVPVRYTYEFPLLTITLGTKSKSPLLPWQKEDTLQLPPEELDAFLNFVPPPSMNLEEVQEEMKGNKTTLTMGDYCLTLSARMAQRIRDDGKWDDLRRVLKEGPDCFATSEFGVTAGYRLSLEKKGGAEKPSSLQESTIYSLFAQRQIEGTSPGSREASVTLNDWRQFAQLCTQQFRASPVDTKQIDEEMARLYAAIEQLTIQKQTLQEPKSIELETVEPMLRATAAKILTLPIVQQASPLIVSSPEDCLANAQKLHFQSPSAFIYHVFKHSRGQFFGPTGFDLAEFERKCFSYLEMARRIVQTPDITSEMPDQEEDATTNHRYYRMKNSATQLWTAQQELFEVKEQFDRSVVWKQNLTYQEWKEDKKTHQPFLSRHAEVVRSFKEKERNLASVEAKMVNTPADTVIVGLTMQDKGRYAAFFRTCIPARKFNLDVASNITLFA